MGVKFTLSTMAAAGLGNIVSDIAGLGFADLIEVWVWEHHDLSIQSASYVPPHMPIPNAALSPRIHGCIQIAQCCCLQAQARKLKWCREPPLSLLQRSMYSTRGEPLCSVIAHVELQRYTKIPLTGRRAASSCPFARGSAISGCLQPAKWEDL